MGRKPTSMKLTEKERSTLEQLAAGKRDMDIAAGEGVKPHTIATRLERILNKLNASTRTEAVAVFVRRYG